MMNEQKPVFTYPLMSCGSTHLKFTKDVSLINGIEEEIFNNHETRGALHPQYTNFTGSIDGTWDSEHWVVRQGEEVAGFVWINHHRKDNSAELQTYILPEWMGHWAGVRSICLTMRYLFEVSSIRCITAYCHAYNTRSMRILEKLMIRDGIRRQLILWQGKYWDEHIFSLLDSDWKEGREFADRILRHS